MTQSKYGFKVNGDTVINASFTTDSCGTSIASGSMDAEMTKGKRISDAQKTTQHDILDALGWLPQEKRALRSAGGKYPQSSHNKITSQ